MAIPFSPRAAFCTLVVMAGFGTAVTAQLPGGLFGLIGVERDGLLAIERGGRPSDEDQRAIVEAVLLVEAGKAGRGAVCVQLSDEGEALASERREIAVLQRAAAAADPAQRAGLIAELDRRRNPVRAWVRPGADQQPLSEENRRELGVAETSLLAAPSSGRIDITLAMHRLPENLRSRGGDCTVVAFAAPVLAGDIAFVETRFAAPGRPQGPALYAVVRDEGRWTVEAMVRP